MSSLVSEARTQSLIAKENSRFENKHIRQSISYLVSGYKIHAVTYFSCKVIKDLIKMLPSSSEAKVILDHIIDLCGTDPEVSGQGSKLEILKGAMKKKGPSPDFCTGVQFDPVNMFKVFSGSKIS